jgi:hypothetical protein
VRRDFLCSGVYFYEKFTYLNLPDFRAENAEKAIKMENAGIFIVTFHIRKRLYIVEKSRKCRRQRKVNDASEVKGSRREISRLSEYRSQGEV